MDEGVALANINGTNGNGARRATQAPGIRCRSSSSPGRSSTLQSGLGPLQPWLASSQSSTGRLADGFLQPMDRWFRSFNRRSCSHHQQEIERGVHPDSIAAFAAFNPAGKQPTFNVPSLSRLLSTLGPMVPNIKQEEQYPPSTKAL